jgi:hypothetical protein
MTVTPPKDAASRLAGIAAIEKWLCPVCGEIVTVRPGVHVPVLDPPTHWHHRRQIELIPRAEL